MKKLLIAALLVFACSQVKAFDPYVDLNESKALSMGHCTLSAGTKVPCFVVEKLGKFYLVMVNESEILLVYSVPSFKHSYEPHELTLIWQKPNPRSMV